MNNYIDFNFDLYISTDLFLRKGIVEKDLIL